VDRMATSAFCRRHPRLRLKSWTFRTRSKAAPLLAAEGLGTRAWFM
jgi:hypothetical protein